MAERISNRRVDPDKWTDLYNTAREQASTAVAGYKSPGTPIKLPQRQLRRWINHIVFTHNELRTLSILRIFNGGEVKEKGDKLSKCIDAEVVDTTLGSDFWKTMRRYNEREGGIVALVNTHNPGYLFKKILGIFGYSQGLDLTEIESVENAPKVDFNVAFLVEKIFELLKDEGGSKSK